MSDSCCPTPDEPSRSCCPACNGRGAAVDVLTVKALLTPTALQRLRPGLWRFCASPTCNTVYFSDGHLPFGVEDIRVPVWQKLVPGDRMICYCFGENEARMREEINRRGQTSVVDRVRQHIADRRCACEIRNPRGVCCLGELTAVVTRLSVLQESVS